VKKIKNLQDGQSVGQLGLRTTEGGDQVPLQLSDITLYVKITAGDEVDKDCSCDSQFMLRTMPEVGAALRASYHWLQPDETIYLVMDNAGGHGTNDAKEQYVNALREHSVEVIWQVPRSPETNMLDLGIWMSIQAKVQQVHFMRRCHHDALATSVEEAWQSYLNINAFTRVFRRIRVVLRCILDDNGGNQRVEAKRGKLFRDATIIDLTEEAEENEEIFIPVDGNFNEEDDDISITSF
jgi:hypothetical protein